MHKQNYYKNIKLWLHVFIILSLFAEAVTDKITIKLVRDLKVPEKYLLRILNFIKIKS